MTYVTTQNLNPHLVQRGNQDRQHNISDNFLE